MNHQSRVYRAFRNFVKAGTAPVTRHFGEFNRFSVSRRSAPHVATGRGVDSVIECIMEAFHNGDYNRLLNIQNEYLGELSLIAADMATAVYAGAKETPLLADVLIRKLQREVA